MSSDNLEADPIDDLDLIETEDLDSGPFVGGKLTLQPGIEDRNERLDKYIAAQITQISRSYIQQLIDDGKVEVDGTVRRRTFKVTPGEVVTVDVPPPVEHELLPEDIPLSILYEDDDVLVIDKPAGLVVHPAPGHAHGTLVNAVLHHCPQIAIAGSNRPGIVHRLDKDTSGVMVVAKSDRGHTALIRQWAERSVGKHYIALVRGVVEEQQATVDLPIGRDPVQRNRMAVVSRGKPAVTHFRVSERFLEATLLDIDLDTGRTHQIRVHLAYIGHPIVGDAVYNRGKGSFGGSGAIVDRQFLHAATLSITLPTGERRTFQAPLPADLNEAIAGLRMFQGEASGARGGA